jgi:hypothetical protein
MQQKEVCMNDTRTAVKLVVLMAVALSAGGAIAADRTVVIEHFTATW